MLNGRLKACTFANFSLEGAMGAATHARNEAVRWVQNPEGFLTIWGNVGNGKTHLAAAACNELLAQGRAPVLINVPELLNWIRGAYDSHGESAADRVSRLQTADVLVLDDFGVQYEKVQSKHGLSWAGEQMYLIVDHRYRLGLPTMITTNVDPDRIERRLRSRLSEYVIVKNTAPDYRARRPK
jgi:DNA replication protein DnaC